MNFWNKLTGLFGAKHHLKNGETAAPFGVETVANETITAELSLKLSAVWACVRLRSQTIGAMPVHLLDNSHAPATSHPLYRILYHEPNADMVASEFWSAMVSSVDLWGNAYAEIVRNGVGDVIALNPLNSAKMHITRHENGELQYRYKNGTEKVYSENEILHLKGFSLDGILGLSPIQYAAHTVGMQRAAEKAATNEFNNTTRIGGWVEVGDRKLSPEQRERLQKYLDEYSKPENFGKFIVFENNVKLNFAPPRISLGDLQLLESRRFGIEEICRMFATPPTLIGHNDKSSSWASSVDGMNRVYLTYAIMPMLVDFEQNIARKLLSASDRKKYRVKFNFEGLLRADQQSRAAFYREMSNLGVMTRNEIRALENLPPIEYGDELTVQVNLTTLKRLVEQQPENGVNE